MLGRVPVERTTLFVVVQRFEDPALDPPSREPQKQTRLAGPARARRQLERELDKKKGISTVGVASATGEARALPLV